ncbi:FAS1-like dehydratase domain-containing protein [Microbacterium sp. A84]|uniref:FAS1-like dehydratase domain-containing protein n=1 Tax=Microbacterium sp. A84 TaxID=3450715 RepID=UPI003F43D597
MTDEDRLASWVGTTQEKTVLVRPEIDSALRGVLGLPEDNGAGFLQGLHWLLFDEFVPVSQIGVDGHPKRGGFLPPIELPRRMWAGSRIEFLAPVHPGDELTRHSTIAAVTPKEGKAGPLVFVTVDHVVSSGNEVLIREQQDIVYMNISPAASRAAEVEFNSESEASTTISPDEVMLFRYSALTRNSHRIHYDADYAREVELYPGLVVHGPLTATLLMWFSSQSAGSAPLRSFAFRGRSPLYVGDPLRLEADHTEDGIATTARNAGGGVGMTGLATVAQ